MSKKSGSANGSVSTFAINRININIEFIYFQKKSSNTEIVWGFGACYSTSLSCIEIGYYYSNISGGANIYL